MSWEEVQEHCADRETGVDVRPDVSSTRRDEPMTKDTIIKLEKNIV